MKLLPISVGRGVQSVEEEPSLRRIVIASAATILIGFGGFFAWACTARLDMAIPANGAIAPEGRRKSISLLYPGILATLYVKEGDHVAAGQPLFRLDDAQLRAQLGSLQVQDLAARLRLQRLQAERNGQSEFELPADIAAAASANPAAAKFIVAETQILRDRWQSYRGTLAIQQKKVRQLEEQLRALESDSAAGRESMKVTEKQLADVEELLKNGYATATLQYDLKRILAEGRGNLGELNAKESEVRQAIAQAELEEAATTRQRMETISEELQEAQAVSADLAEKIKGAQDLLDKAEVAANVAGVVTDLKAFTPGSAITAGQPVLDIVPDGGHFMVEANVRPDDIEHVGPGARVNVRLTAYKQHKIPVLTGHVVYVSADAQTDPKGEVYFLVRAEVDAEALAAFKHVRLTPGMPAEVLILGGERTAIDYFLSPITQSLHRSLRED